MSVHEGTLQPSTGQQEVLPPQPGPLSLVEDNRGFPLIGSYHGVATPALLCHKEPAQVVYNCVPFAGSKDRWLPCTERIYY